VMACIMEVKILIILHGFLPINLSMHIRQLKEQKKGFSEFGLKHLRHFMILMQDGNITIIHPFLHTFMLITLGMK